MTTTNIAAAAELSAKFEALATPMQNTGHMLTKLAESVTTTLSGTTATAPIVDVEGGTASSTANTGKSDDPLTAGATGFFEGLFNGINEQFHNFFTKLFGGDGEESLFSALGVGGKKETDDGTDSANASESSEEVSKADATVAEDKKKNDDERVKSDAKAWGAMVGNALAGSKKLRKIQKAMAIGSVIIDTAKGIAKAFADHGFPGGLIPAAILAAKGAAQISTIKGQAHDGLTKVPNTGTYLLEKGERVVGSRLNADLQGFLSAQGEKTAQALAGNTVNNSPSINLTINGDASGDAVASNRGALEGMIRDIFADYAMDAPFG